MADTLTTRLRELMEEATPGEWEWQTGSSWTRLGTNGRGGTRDGNVICPFVNQYDRHPDLSIKNCDADLIVTLVNNLPTIIRLLEAGDGAEKALEGIDTFAWSSCVADFPEARDEVMKRITVARSALATLRAAREGAR